VRQLNVARVAFKHHGILPDARDWFRVIDKTWAWVDQWCETYLRLGIDDVNLERLLSDPDVKRLYESAKQLRHAGRYKEALEEVGKALYFVLWDFTGNAFPAVGIRNTDDAMALSAFGVPPSDFLALQEFLPHVTVQLPTRALYARWNERETGHAGNWTDDNVRFCLDTFLDLALKIQHAPPTPRALPYAVVFDDVITPKGESADLFVFEFDGHPFLQQVSSGHSAKEKRCGVACPSLRLVTSQRKRPSTSLTF
jgi:hypothetical protein